MVVALTQSPDPVLSLERVDDLQRQCRTIVHRCQLVSYVLASSPALPVGEALVDLLADVTGAARTIVTLLQTATRRA